MKHFRITWTINDTTFSTKVTTMTNREEKEVVKSALIKLKRDGVSIDHARFSSPPIVEELSITIIE